MKGLSSGTDLTVTVSSKQTADTVIAVSTIKSSKHDAQYSLD